jgi:hypothetical protein
MRIVLVCERGYYRDGLVALLRTLPNLDVICVDADAVARARPSVQAPDIVIVDGDILTVSLCSIRECWTGSKILVLVDRFNLRRDDSLAEADGILSKSLSAGEFLSSVQNTADDRLAVSCNDMNVTAPAEVW